ncbi:MAG: PQQ-binding-like beta-propeller repeat protein [Phycisphaerae bacterium]
MGNPTDNWFARAVTTRSQGQQQALSAAGTQCVTITALVLMALVPVVRAQAPLPKDDLPAVGLDAKGVPAALDKVVEQDDAAAPDGASIYLNDSFEAMDLLVSAQRFAGRGEWFEAAEVVRAAMRQHGDKLITIDDQYYTNVSYRFRSLVSSWPEEGVAAYQRLIATEFDERMERLGESKSLHEYLTVLNQYYSAEGSDLLVDRAGELALEAGAFALAERLFRDAATIHIAKEDKGAQWRAMEAIARSLGGSAVDESRGAVRDTNIRVPWRGRVLAVSEILQEVDKTFGLPDVSGTSGRWPVFGGAASRHRPTQTRVTDLGLLWRVDSVPKARTHLTPGGFDEDPAAEQPGRMGVEPVVASGLVLLQHLRDVVAINLNTGAEVWRFRADSAANDEDEDLDDFPTGWYSVVVHDDRVYAAIPGDTAPYYGYESARSIAELVCLDLATGRPIWRSSRLNLGDSFSELSFDSSPLVASNRVFVVGRRRRSFGFEDCYLQAFDATDGSSLFRTHIGSASTGTFGSQRSTVSIPGLSGDTVYVCTNLGTVAAVSAYTGAVRWLRLYDRLDDSRSKHGSWSSGRTRPWEFNPTLIDNGKIYCLPIDANDLLILDQSNGDLLQRVSLESLSQMRTLIGVKGNLVCGSGDEVVCYDTARHAMLWSSPIPRSDPVMGRGSWNGDHLMIPTSQALHLVDVDSGSMRSVTWPPEGSGGNILALPDRFMVANGRQLSLYVQKDEIWSSVRSRMFASPDDPSPALDLAEVAFGSGEFDQAVEALGEAVDRLDRMRSDAVGDHRTRVFTDSLVFAEKLAVRNALSVETADELLRYASMFAISTHDHVRYRIRFARVFEQLAVPTRAVDLWQQILLDAALRDATFADLGLSDKSAAAVAEQEIAAYITARGPEIYGPYERRSSRLFAAARDIGDTVALMNLSLAFPNSSTAPDALLLAATLLSSEGDPDSALQAYLEAYYRYGDRIDRGEVIRQIADTCATLGHINEAHRWLSRAAREFPNRLFEYRGSRLSFASYGKRLRPPDVLRRLPKIALPFHHGFVRDIGEGDRLLHPQFADHPSASWDRYFVRTDDGVRAFDANANVAAWPRVVSFASTPELLLDMPDASLFLTRTQLTAISSAGEPLWRMIDWESIPPLRIFDTWQNRLLASQGDRLLCIDLTSGRVLWERNEHPRPGRKAVMTRQWIAYDTTRGGDSAIYVLHAETGELASVISTNEAWAVESLSMTFDGRLLLLTARSITLYDIDQQSAVWRANLDGQLEPETVILDVDGIYLSDDGRRIKKYSLYDGYLAWSSPRLLPRIQQSIRAEFIDGSIIMSSTSAISAFDPITRLPLWQATQPEDPRFRFRGLSASYLAALHVPNEMEGAESTAYFYDHRNGSGLIPEEGGIVNLGSQDDVRVVTLARNALIVQTGSTIYGWTHQAPSQGSAP